MPTLDKFTRGYIDCALWSSTDEEGKPLDKNFDISDLAPECLTRMIDDCAKFQEQNGELLTSEHYNFAVKYDISEYAGHDFWLTRNRHGAGFWDGDWVSPAGDRLTVAAHNFGECDLYVGDDRKIYCA